MISFMLYGAVGEQQLSREIKHRISRARVSARNTLAFTADHDTTCVIAGFFVEEANLESLSATFLIGGA